MIGDSVTLQTTDNESVVAVKDMAIGIARLVVMRGDATVSVYLPPQSVVALIASLRRIAEEGGNDHA